jgi:hypothetical protein
LALFRAGELGPIGFDPLVFGFVRRVGRSGNPLRNCAGRPRRRKRRIGAAPRASTMQASPKCNQIERSSFPPPSPFLSWSAAPTRTLPARGHYTIRCKTFGKLCRSLARMRKSEPPAQARGSSRVSGTSRIPRLGAKPRGPGAPRLGLSARIRICNFWR